MSPRRNIWTIGLLLATILVSCSPVGREEAERVVAQADSLRAEGQMYGDSVQLAQAYRTLKRRSFLNFRLASPFAHACYHYGRLLRAQDDPVSAMQVFIDATHSRTRDYHILGRVYSNMGNMCRLYGSHDLAYNNYQKSADYFWRGGDTTSYYYAQNNMAFECIESSEFEQAVTLLDTICSQCQNRSILDKVCESKIILFKRTQQYDSVIQYIDSIRYPRNNETTILVSKAQAYYYLQEYDSAACYAQRTLEVTKSLFDKDNAYYILIHCDSVHSGNNIYTLNANRADVEKEIEQRHGKLSRAVQLLEQDLSRKPDWRWLYAFIAFLLFIGSCCVLYYILSKRKQHYQIIHDLQKKEKEHILLEQTINNLSQLKEVQHQQIITDIESVCKQISDNKNIRTELCWNDYEKMCSIVDKHFYFLSTKLTQKQLLNETEIRLCVLVLLDMSRAQIADTLPYSLNSVGKLKDQTAKKLGTTGKNLRNFLENMAIEG